MAYVPDRGDVAWINFDPQAGHEQAGRRPALVLTSAIYNAPSTLAIVCPITSKAKGYPYEVPIPSGLPVAGVVLADHARSLDWHARNAQFICTLPPNVVAVVKRKLHTLI